MDTIQIESASSAVSLSDVKIPHSMIMTRYKERETVKGIIKVNTKFDRDSSYEVLAIGKNVKDYIDIEVGDFVILESGSDPIVLNTDEGEIKTMISYGANVVMVFKNYVEISSESINRPITNLGVTSPALEDQVREAMNQ